ncbi:MAG: prepilin-type N-terminal cleavage/methylation domain-containing protein [Planctomycetota bacterium]
MKIFRRSSGFSLIEAMVAIIILSVGLLALATLQARLMRSSADGKLQSAALAMAKAEIERQRTFRDAASWRNDIVDAPAATVNLSIGGQNFAFTRSMVVDRFQWNPAAATPAFVPVADAVALNGQPDFKRVVVAVTWANESGETRQVTLSDVLGSIMPADSASLVSSPNGSRTKPLVRIFAPSAEGIIPIAIGDGMASASSNPKPVQFNAAGGATLTRFNVQNYLSDGGNPLLQRRLEFAYASCKCTLNTATSTATDPAYEPTVWTGERYTAPRPIVGRAVSQAIDQINDSGDVNRFDDLCTSCCRDHQDDGQSVTERPTVDTDPALLPRYEVDPFRAHIEYAPEFGRGPHKHYINASPTLFLTPPLVVATAGNQYFEACRLVRVDGINRVAVDSRLENLVSLNLSPTQRTNPNNALAMLPTSLASRYATFAKRYVENALGIDTSSTPVDSSLALPSGYPVGGLVDQIGRPATPGDSTANPPIPPTPATFTALAREFDTEFLDLDEDDRTELPLGKYHNLSARGIYIDFLTSETRSAIACIGNTARNCAAFRNKNPLELVPFFAVNLTNLNYFNEFPSSPVTYLEPNGFPQTYGQDFVRGRVRADASGNSRIRASTRRGNAGVTDQIPIYPDSAEIINEGEPFQVGGNQTSHQAAFALTCPTCAPDSVFFTKMGEKQLNTTPDGSACGFGPNDNSIRECTTGTDTSIISVSALFATYVFPTCADGRNTYNPATNLCERRQGPNLITAPAVIADFTLCRLTNLPAGVTASVGAPVSPGVPAETTTATLDGNGLALLLDTTLPSSPIQAVFVPSTGTCPP